MRFSRRDFLGSSTLILGSRAIELLSTPLGKWRDSLLLRADPVARPESNSQVTYVDVAAEAGLTTPDVWGGVKVKKYIVEAKGSGLAFFDFDHDGWLDVYLTNGVRFGETYSPQNAPTSHLY